MEYKHFILLYISAMDKPNFFLGYCVRKLSTVKISFRQTNAMSYQQKEKQQRT